MTPFTLFDKNDADLLQLNFDSNEILSVQMYEILENMKQTILSQTDKFTLEDLWYSEYYWYLVLMKEQNVQNSADFQQGLFRVIERMDYQIASINFTVLERLEKEILKER